MATPLPPISAPATLAAAYIWCEAIYDAHSISQKATARTATNTADQATDTTCAAAGSLPTLAQILNSCFNYLNGVLLALWRVWCYHHRQWVNDPKVIDYDANVYILCCNTFREVVFVLEDEFQVVDQVFENTRGL
jgi:hypothetical protein